MTYSAHTIVSESAPEQAAADLEEALNEGLLLPASDSGTRVAELKIDSPVVQAQAAQFRFLHDRVQQAAYSLIPDAEKRLGHLRVERLLLHHGDAEALEERLFDIVGDLNTGAPFIRDRQERTQLAALNAQAGRKAKRSTAYQPALNYFTEGIAHLPDDAWKAQYELAFALHLEQAECNYLCGHFDEAERELDRLLEQAQSPLERAEIYRIRIVQYENTDRFPEAREWGKKGLSLFGIVFPDDAAERQAALEAEMREINEKVGSRDIEDLVGLPVIFECRFQLVQAEQEALQGNVAEAITAYERAIATAAENGFVQIEALAHECFAGLWTQRGNETIAQSYRRTANERYRQWGALAKVQALEARHPHLRKPAEGKSLAYGPETLDVKTVIKAAQILSGEIEQRQLLDRLMQRVMANAGAQRGFLLLEGDNRFVVEAAGTAPEDDPSGLHESPSTWDRYLSSAIVHYVARVGEHVVVGDAALDARFENDPYIREHAPLSVLCTPILHQGKPIGILYLENNLATSSRIPRRRFGSAATH